jgi:hypothetical protein
MQYLFIYLFYVKQISRNSINNDNNNQYYKGSTSPFLYSYLIGRS